MATRLLVDERKGVLTQIDSLSVLIWLALTTIGFFSIYSSEFGAGQESWFNLSTSHGKQIMNFGIGSILAIFVMLTDSRLIHTISYLLYALSIFLLIITLAIGKTVSGAKGWIDFGPMMLQTAEVAKLGTALALSRFLSGHEVNIGNKKDMFKAIGLIAFPLLLVLLQNDTGSALVFLSFFFVLYRMGLSGWFLVIPAWLGVLAIMVLVFDKISVLIAIGIIVALAYVFYARFFSKILPILALFIVFSAGVIFSVDYAINDILKDYQRERIEVLIGKKVDPKGVGYNVHQSLIAIGSGGLTGKGFLNGTQTKFKFVPEQSTDFIFCTIGEETGLLGSFIVVILYLTLIFRILVLAERQKFFYNKCYGYGIVAILFFHFTINIGMTLGLFPVIGIPLPFLSYGGSSYLMFTIMLFLMLKMDADNASY
ncbi:MAG: rod shape-determining protein RodA [Bacteroidota bacterium]|nr:rod shape-determining protein RodA [Bacteroidota bacterium]